MPKCASITKLAFIIVVSLLVAMNLSLFNENQELKAKAIQVYNLQHNITVPTSREEILEDMATIYRIVHRNFTKDGAYDGG